MLVIDLSVVTVLHSARSAFLAWHFCSATVPIHTVRCHTLVGRWATAIVVPRGNFERIFGALDTTVHGGLARRCFLVVLLETLVGAFGVAAGHSWRSRFIDHLSLGVGLVLGCVTIDVP